jgi:ADP-heptose:LPS heptosyltransferase
MADSSIAFITAHRLGDALSHTPTVRYLKQVFPSSEISIITTSPEATTIFEGNPNISKVYDTSKGIPQELSGRRFDLSISSCKKKDAISIFQATCGAQLILNGITQNRVEEQTKEQHKQMHVAARSVEKLRQLFPNTPKFNDYRYELPFTDRDKKNVDDTLQQWGIATQPLISLHLGCRSLRKRFGFGKKELAHEKAWRLGHATRFCQLLAEHHPEVRCLATGTQGEGTYTRQLANTCPNVIDAVDMLSIKEAAALMHHLKACIVPDTGMLHLASTTPVHIVGLYAVTDPAITGPYPGRTAHTAIQRESMDAITGDMVFDAVHLALTASEDSATDAPLAT